MVSVSQKLMASWGWGPTYNKIQHKYWEKSILSAVKVYEEHLKLIEREENLGKASEDANAESFKDEKGLTRGSRISSRGTTPDKGWRQERQDYAGTAGNLVCLGLGEYENAEKEWGWGWGWVWEL